MKSSRFLLFISALFLITSTFSCTPKVDSWGYYKDVFMDSGIHLEGRRDLPATRFLGLSMETFVAACYYPCKLTAQDTIRQNELMCGSPLDENGILLYPDGEPRFRMIYVNGGLATKHGNSLTPEGRENVRKYIENGGSYVGSCAGMFLASNGVYNEGTEYTPNKSYLSIWPGTTAETWLNNSYTTVRLPKDSPLLKYYDFGGDMKIDSLRHSNGGFAYYGKGGIIPEGTEPLLRFVYDTVSVDSKSSHIHDQVCAWAYKKNEESGRLVITGSHPEMFSVGERLELMAAMVRYAMDGNGAVAVKGDLIPGEVRQMNKSTEDEDPLFTKIGDRQYHHFTVEIPKRTKEAVIFLQGYKGADNFDLTLAACYNEPAFHDKTSIKNVLLGCNKKLVLKNPKAGKWYISVFCETTVTAETGDKGVIYTGRTDVLNGVPYKIKVVCKE
jgi:glutamine amidotransferase-like uncharacterized protein